MFSFWMIINILMITLNQAMFMHTHRLPDGSVVTHAHPFKRSADQGTPHESHSHTQVEFQFFGSIGIIIAAFCTGVVVVLHFHVIARIERQITFHSAERLIKILGRAPPAF
ncbi:MAG: hypothetical protein ACOCX8_04335 [Bacteroidota bacterium]